MARGRKTGGREKGTPNKIGGAVRENVISVFETLGGTKQMADWARENLTEFYRLYARLLPTEATLNVKHGDAGSLTDAELADIAAGSRKGIAEKAGGETKPSRVH